MKTFRFASIISFRPCLRQAINRPTRDTAMLFIHAWSDTRQVRTADSKAYAVLNDEQPISGSIIDAFRNYDIRPVPWTQRVEVVTELLPSTGGEYLSWLRFAG